MNKHKRLFVTMALTLVMIFAVAPMASAMHIMEGYLPAKYCIIWACVAAPFVIWGFVSLNKITKQDRSLVPIIAMAGAYVFVLSSLKIPSVTGSSSHMTGTGLGAILLGPAAVSVLGLIVLVFQALLLAHGGLTTLGANTCSMAIAGPFVTYGLYQLFNKMHMNKKVNIFLSAALGDLVTYCVTSYQLALAYPSEVGGVAASAGKFLGVFAVTQVPLAILEGILTVLVVMGLENIAQPELLSLQKIQHPKQLQKEA